VALAMAAISFVNPYGWRALAQPFEYFLFWRHEAIFRTIVELRPVAWHDLVDSPLGLVLVLWPALIAWRAYVGYARLKLPNRWLLLLVAAAGGLVFAVRRRRNAPDEPALVADEKRLVERVLGPAPPDRGPGGDAR